MANGSNDHFCVLEIWHKKQLLSKIYSISPNVLVIMAQKTTFVKNITYVTKCFSYFGFWYVT